MGVETSPLVEQAPAVMAPTGVAEPSTVVVGPPTGLDAAVEIPPSDPDPVIDEVNAVVATVEDVLADSVDLGEVPGPPDYRRTVAELQQTADELAAQAIDLASDLLTAMPNPAETLAQLRRDAQTLADMAAQLAEGLRQAVEEATPDYRRTVAELQQTADELAAQATQLVAVVQGIVVGSVPDYRETVEQLERTAAELAAQAEQLGADVQRYVTETAPAPADVVAQLEEAAAELTTQALELAAAVQVLVDGAADTVVGAAPTPAQVVELAAGVVTAAQAFFEQLADEIDGLSVPPLPAPPSLPTVPTVPAPGVPPTDAAPECAQGVPNVTVTELPGADALSIADLAGALIPLDDPTDVEFIAAETLAVGVEVAVVDCVPVTVATPVAPALATLGESGSRDARQPNLSDTVRTPALNSNEYGAVITKQGDGSNFGARWWVYETVSRDTKGRPLVWWQNSDINAGDKTNFTQALATTHQEAGPTAYYLDASPFGKTTIEQSQTLPVKVGFTATEPKTKAGFTAELSKTYSLSYTEWGGALSRYDNGRVSLHTGGFLKIAKGHRNESRRWSEGAGWIYPPGTSQTAQMVTSVRYAQR